MYISFVLFFINEKTFWTRQSAFFWGLAINLHTSGTLWEISLGNSYQARAWRLSSRVAAARNFGRTLPITSLECLSHRVFEAHAHARACKPLSPLKAGRCAHVSVICFVSFSLGNTPSLNILVWRTTTKYERSLETVAYHARGEIYVMQQVARASSI